MKIYTHLEQSVFRQSLISLLELKVRQEKV